MELVIEQGRGYVPVEARENHRPELGMIALDAIFTPIKSVHFDVSNVHIVGQLTNFDKLEIVMETDGGMMSGREWLISPRIFWLTTLTMMFSAASWRWKPAPTITPPANGSPR